jgi:uncharacterized alkaline shock family protein YloU
LVGKSGTGKSFQALNLCAELGIDSIIDDGLFIVEGHILAGESAKRQETKIRAVKTALFTDESLRDEVKAKIEEIQTDSILVIGTSAKMTAQICERLRLPPPHVRIDIESLTTQEERDTAYKQRYEMGQHIIPAPTLQVKKDFSGYFLHPLRMIRNDWDGLIDGWVTAAERSVVRPTYSYMGKYSISDRAIMDIVTLAGEQTAGVDAIPLIFIKNRKEGMIIDMSVTMQYGRAVLPAAKALQRAIARDVEAMTSLNILSVDIRITGLK